MPDTKLASWEGSVTVYPTPISDVKKHGLRFTITGSGHVINYIKLLTTRFQAANNFVIDIYATSGGYPVGGSLGNITVAASELSTSPNYTTFTFADPISVDAGTYAIVWHCVPYVNESNDVGVGRSSQSQGTGAIFYNGTSWTDFYPNYMGSYFSVWETATVPSKPINPTPTNNSTTVDFSGLTLGWQNGGGATSYDVRIGPSGSLVKVSSSQVGTSYVTNINEVPYNQVIYWRIDAINAVGTTTGDIWNFDARPAKATNVYPTHQAAGITLDDTTASWTAGSANTTAYDVYFGYLSGFTELIASDITDLSCVLSENFYTYGDVYYWKVKAKNQFGITDGDEWYFTTLIFKSPKPSGATDWNEGGGYWEGTLTGANNMLSIKRLVLASDDMVWYEDL